MVSEGICRTSVIRIAALGGVRRALEHIRAIPNSAELNRKLAEKVLEMPVLAIGAGLSFGKYMAEGARRFARHVSGLVAQRSRIGFPKSVPIGFQNGC
jgi:hypothetical protein